MPFRPPAPRYSRRSDSYPGPAAHQKNASPVSRRDTESRLRLSELRGKKVVVIDFWATWCGPCMKGIPHLSELAARAKGQDIEFIAVNTSDDEVPFARFATAKANEYAFTLARDPAGRDPNGNTIAHKLFGVTGIPATFVIDKDGKVAGTVVGFQDGDTTLETLIEKQGIQLMK